MLDELCEMHPDLERRREKLRSMVLRRGLVWVVTEANRKPVTLSVSSTRREVNSGKIGALVGHHGEIGEAVHEDPVFRKEELESVDALIRAPRPEHNVRVRAMEHEHVSPEAVNLPGEFGVGDMLPVGNQREDGFGHFLENVKGHPPATGSATPTRGKALYSSLRFRLAAG